MDSKDRRSVRGEGRRKTKVVLLVDDEPQVLSALRRALRSEPYEILWTQDPHEALETVRTRRIDLVLADQKMPDMEGTELLRMIRQESPGTLCALLTGYPDTDTVVRRLGLRPERLLTKPWEAESLRRELRVVLGLGTDGRPAGRKASRGVPHRVECRDRDSQWVIEEILSIVSASSGPTDVRLVLDNVGSLRGSVTKFFLDLLRLASRFEVRLNLVESSGYAAAVLGSISGSERYASFGAAESEPGP